MAWHRDTVMEFLDLYESESVIWNPRHRLHKDRTYVYGAWKRIQSKFSIKCSLQELKKRKETIMATYRKVEMKVRNSKRARAGTNKLYKPEWFAYNKMASFLNTVYKPRGPETSVRLQNEPSNNEEILLGNQYETNSNVADPVEFPVVNTVCQDELIRVSANPIAVEKECFMFCQLLCYRLRALDDTTREIVMHEINNLMFHLKYSRKTSPNMPHYYQLPDDFNSNVQISQAINQYQSSVCGSGKSSASVSPAQALLTTSTPQLSFDDNEIEMVHKQNIVDLIRNFKPD